MKGDLLTEEEWNALVDAFCDLTYRGKQLTPFHADALVRISLPVIAALVEQREETARREALLEAAEELDSLGRGCSPEYATWLRDRAGGES